ncbi:DNA polymerase-1 [Actinokineospora baliensis]|uniref:DNA polymerase n=1 Tax=Actinokineospora baliensis TaxID=547056 RepID=UPI00195D1C71|nr:DNA polymerase [Actinokineospora baliensis]MBM7770611.1 DNA polymerase-1 [Actinokineospora baliensis]
MRHQRHTVAGEPVHIRTVETGADIGEFLGWCRDHAAGPVAFDTETTGLDVHTTTARLRLAQFGTRSQAWVLPVDPQGGIRGALDACARALTHLPRLVAHSATFDATVAATHVPGIALDRLWPRLTDTRILAHLVDPRGPDDPGGIGHGLEALTARHIDVEVAATIKGSMAAMAARLGVTKAEVFRTVDLWDEEYRLYAGMDVILTARLEEVLTPAVAAGGWEQLVEFEHAVALVCARMQARGFLLDVDYTERLADRLGTEAHRWSGVAARYGVRSVNSTAQVADALVGMGERLTETTDSGAYKVDKEVLKPLADLDREWERIGARTPNPLADAVLRAKRAGKWFTTYAESMLAHRDGTDRIHPVIASLKARTARMSISAPPLQQLPSGDSTIREALIAEPGHVVGAVDYQAVELRVLAALAQDHRMVEAIHAGEDLHGFTARLIYGDGYTATHRKVCKGIGFGKVYGGGPDTLSRTTGAPLSQVVHAIREYDRVYTGIRRYSSRLIRRAEWGPTQVITPAGRRLPLDRRRLYAATNYVVQSSARDVLAEALLRLDEAGLTDWLRLPVHDEVVFVAPETDAEEIGRAIARAMHVPDFFGVPLATELTLGGRSWGSLYRDGEHRTVASTAVRAA